MYQVLQGEGAHKQAAAENERIRFRIAFGEAMPKEAEEAIIALLMHQGVLWRPGPARKGPLEKQVAHILERMGKGSASSK